MGETTKVARWLNPIASDAEINKEISNNFPKWFKQYVGFQVLLEVDTDVINNSLVDVDEGGEEVDVQLLDQLDLDKPYEGEYISESDKESDFDDTDSS
ncbi:hypothetical protein VNO78_12500 [Psophocarpus tetragonolobus]|uniref:Uncharacterized protein n=1 Tax=Psophocarpus tetragonolobus TaxID=3891 RepID=A0AAN9SVP1_PSOTE